MTFREILLRRIEHTVRLATAGDTDDLTLHLEIKSDEELLEWHDRIQALRLQQRGQGDVSGG